jgi:vacuolar-type H+-ATPase subunit H
MESAEEMADDMLEKGKEMATDAAEDAVEAGKKEIGM